MTGVSDVSLAEVILNGAGGHARAHLITWAAGTEGLAEGVLERHARVFEAEGVYIGDIIANDVDFFLELLESANGGTEGSKHKFICLMGLR